MAPVEIDQLEQSQSSVIQVEGKHPLHIEQANKADRIFLTPEQRVLEKTEYQPLFRAWYVALEASNDLDRQGDAKSDILVDFKNEHGEMQTVLVSREKIRTFQQIGIEDHVAERMGRLVKQITLPDLEGKPSKQDWQEYQRQMNQLSQHFGIEAILPYVEGSNRALQSPFYEGVLQNQTDRLPVKGGGRENHLIHSAASLGMVAATLVEPASGAYHMAVDIAGYNDQQAYEGVVGWRAAEAQGKVPGHAAPIFSGHPEQLPSNPGGGLPETPTPVPTLEPGTYYQAQPDSQAVVFAEGPEQGTATPIRDLQQVKEIEVLPSGWIKVQTSDGSIGFLWPGIGVEKVSVSGSDSTAPISNDDPDQGKEQPEVQAPPKDNLLPTNPDIYSGLDPALKPLIESTTIYLGTAEQKQEIRKLLVEAARTDPSIFYQILAMGDQIEINIKSEPIHDDRSIFGQYTKGNGKQVIGLPISHMFPTETVPVANEAFLFSPDEIWQIRKWFVLKELYGSQHAPPSENNNAWEAYTWGRLKDVMAGRGDLNAVENRFLSEVVNHQPEYWGNR
ncbi:hypothetical protein GYA49_03675 [Candidatus Beckwithbacteria bacterium]|nr:hypothetical protein [Candidatus Beckwithbacteria bacterium]